MEFTTEGIIFMTAAMGVIVFLLIYTLAKVFRTESKE